MSSAGRYVATQKIQLDTITNVEMLSMLEREKRGGLCFVGSKIKVKSNSKYLSDSNPEHEWNYMVLVC